MNSSYISYFLNACGLLGLVLAGSLHGIAGPISTTIFTYTGLPYIVNPDPTDFGTLMTASVTLHCNPCADTPNISLSDPIVLDAEITSGQGTISLATAVAD